MFVTGGKGFIGTNLCEMVSADTFDLKTDIMEDITRYEYLIEGYDKGPIIHLAADPGVPQSFEYPAISFVQNTLGTFNVLRLAKEKITRIILASSAANLTSPYGASKRCGEIYAETFHNAYGLSYCALKFGNVYGPHSQHKSSVVANMINNALEHNEIIIYGDGQQTRDFIHVHDICKAIISASQSGFNGVLEVGSGRQHSVMNVAEIISEALKCKITHRPERRGDVSNARSDITYTRPILNWEPEIDFEDGIKKTVRWFREISSV